MVGSSLLSFSKMRAALSCITKGQSKAILFSYMHPHCCSVQQRA